MRAWHKWDKFFLFSFFLSWSGVSNTHWRWHARLGYDKCRRSQRAMAWLALQNWGASSLWHPYSWWAALEKGHTGGTPQKQFSSKGFNGFWVHQLICLVKDILSCTWSITMNVEAIGILRYSSRGHHFVALCCILKPLNIEHNWVLNSGSIVQGALRFWSVNLLSLCFWAKCGNGVMLCCYTSHSIVDIIPMMAVFQFDLNVKQVFLSM